MIRLFTVLFVMITTSVYAEDITIEMLNKRDDGAKMVYSEDITRINAGDTIKLYLYHDEGGTEGIQTGQESTFLSGVRIG